MNIATLIKNKKFIIVLHEFLPTGPGHDLRDFLLKNHAKEIIFMTHPMLNLKEGYVNRSRMKIYIHNKINEAVQKLHFILPMSFLYFKDLLLTLWWLGKISSKYDLYVGLDPLNAFAGIILRKMGRVDKVVYYTIDYVPKRYSNTVLNFIYHKLDKFCVYFADDTWNVGPEVIHAREIYNHMKRKIYFKQYNVPIGFWPDKVKPLPFEKVNRYKLIYVGGLRHIMGVDLIIDTMPKLIKKFPRIRLEIVGSGIDEVRLKDKAKQLKIEKYILFHGWIRERKRIESLSSDAAIGLATFNTDKYSIEVKNADPAKIKEYLSLGLPVITTNVTPHHKELLRSKCALVISYSVDSLVQAVGKLVANKKLLKAYRQHARSYVSQFEYPVMFSNALKRVL